jgi:hypothetical protein
MNDDLHTLSGAYALHALPEYDERLFEEHMARCEACMLEVRGLRETAARLGMAAAETPSPSLRARVMTRITEVRQEPPLADQPAYDPTSPARGTPPGVGSPAFTPPSRGTPGLGTPGLGTRGLGSPGHGTPGLGSAGPGSPGSGSAGPGRGGRRASRRRAARGSWRTKVAVGLAVVSTAAAVAFGYLTVSANRELDQVRSQAQAVAAVLAAPDAKAVTRAVKSGGSATIVRSRSRGRVVFAASGLSGLPAAKAYELWLMGPDGARPAGLLRWSADGTAVPVVALPLSGEDRVGLTVEPAGGSAKPTTDPILLTKLPSA